MNMKISKKRILGVAFFSFIVGSFFNKAVDFTLPEIIATIKGIDKYDAFKIYDASFLPEIFLTFLATFIAALTASFLIRKKQLLTAFIANSLYLLAYLAGLVIFIIYKTDFWAGNISVQLYLFILVGLTILGTLSGAFLGKKYYSEDLDLDLNNSKLTLFGIRWFHYFWILPIIIYPFLSSLLIALYLSLITLIADFYFGIHPSLWFNIIWWIYSILSPIIVMLVFWMIYVGFSRFWSLMQYNQNLSKGWKKILKVLLYGLIMPAISYSLAAIGASIIHNMPKPAFKDWKIGLILLLVIPSLGFISWVYQTTKDRIKKLK